MIRNFKQCGRRGSERCDRLARTAVIQPLLWVAAALFLLVTVPGVASAQSTTRAFVLDPARSRLTIDAVGTLLDLEWSSLFGVLPMPLASPGVGDPLPGGGTSDGLTTSVSGSLMAVIGSSDLSIIARRTTLSLDTSGTFLPGLPNSPETAAPADLALIGTDSILGIMLNGAIRDAVATFGLATTALAGDFPKTFDAATTSSAILLSGSYDSDANLVALAGRSALPALSAPNTATAGVLRDLGDDMLEIEIPLDITLALALDEIGGGLPFSASLHLTGQLVAISVPEPSAALLACAAFASLALLKRAGSGRLQ